MCTQRSSAFHASIQHQNYVYRIEYYGIGFFQDIASTTPTSHPTVTPPLRLPQAGRGLLDDQRPGRHSQAPPTYAQAPGNKLLFHIYVIYPSVFPFFSQAVCCSDS